MDHKREELKWPGIIAIQSNKDSNTSILGLAMDHPETFKCTAFQLLPLLNLPNHPIQHAMPTNPQLGKAQLSVPQIHTKQMTITP